MTYLRLGNLKIKEIESYLGIKFTSEHLDILESSRVDKVSETDNSNFKIGKYEWHAFELPTVQIHCGSQEFAETMKVIISSYMTDGSFPNKVRIGITNEVLEEEEFGYAERQNMIENNLEIYVGKKVSKSDDYSYSTIQFFVKTKETAAGNIFLQQVSIKKSPNYFSDNLVVPNVEEVASYPLYGKDVSGIYITDENELPVIIGYEPIKPIRKKKTENDTYKVEDMFYLTTINKWDGKPVKMKF